MSTRKKKNIKARASRSAREETSETRASEALTVAWTVTVTTVLLCNLTNLAAHFYLNSHPEAKRMELLQQLMLLAGALVGALSLIMLPILYRVRRVLPPTGFVVFGACVAAAPILTALMRMLG